MSSDVSELEIGQVLVSRDFALTRDTLVRYAGASGDFNPIHYRDDIAESVGLPGVLAHGMLTMGIAIQPLVEWCGPRFRLVSYQVRFIKPLVVDAQDGAGLRVDITVGAISQLHDDTSPQIDCNLTVTSNTGDKVLGKAQAVITPV